MLDKIKSHFNKTYNLVFWILFAPAMIIVLSGIYDLYANHFNELTKEHHMGFFLRFFFPLSIALYVTSLERAARKRREQLQHKIKKYLDS